MPHAKELTKPKALPAAQPKTEVKAQQKKAAVASNSKTKTSTKSSSKAGKALATCPVNGAGWCPYPFSVEQLERRLKEKAAALAASKQV